MCLSAWTGGTLVFAPTELEFHSGRLRLLTRRSFGAQKQRQNRFKKTSRALRFVRSPTLAKRGQGWGTLLSWLREWRQDAATTAGEAPAVRRRYKELFRFLQCLDMGFQGLGVFAFGG